MSKKTQSENKKLGQTIAQLRKKVSELQKKLQKQDQQFNTLLDAIPDLVYLKDKQGRNLMVNKAYADFLGLKKEVIIGKKDQEFLDPKLAEQCRKSDEDVYRNKKLVRVDEKTGGDAEEAVYFNTFKSPIFDNQGHVKGLVGISRNLTEIRKKEEQIKKSLKEKEVLLTEIHHRAKNNMQIISSLLNLQAKNIKEQDIKQKFDQCRTRIKAMSLVHERLYQSNSLAKINFPI